MRGERAYWCSRGKFYARAVFPPVKGSAWVLLSTGENLYWYTFFRGWFYPGAVFPGEVLCGGKLYATTPVLLWYNEEISFHMHYSTCPGNFLKLLQVLKNGMLQEKMGKNLVTNYPIFGPVELPPIWLQCNFITEIRSQRCVVCIYTSILWINVSNHSLTSKTLCPRTKMHRKVTAVETPNETYSTFCTISA